MSKIKIRSQNDDGQKNYEYEHNYGAKDFFNDSTSTSSTPSLDDYLKDY